MTGNIRHVIDDETLYSLLPSDAFSWNLTNRILFLWMVMVLLVPMHYSIHRKNVREKGGRKFVVIFPTRHYPYSQTHSTRIRTRRHFLIVVSFSFLWYFYSSSFIVVVFIVVVRQISGIDVAVVERGSSIFLADAEKQTRQPILFVIQNERPGATGKVCHR
mmetsp:Transcript_31856/g.32310  ORF Transcript_31856/g.32310 Transcript_31856/m.32310 type:complete len:161 (-) Transcript_31856:119-601(-)